MSALRDTQGREEPAHARELGDHEGDLEEADPQRVRTDLMTHDLVSEEYGGQTIAVNVSAKTGEGIDQLLEYINLVAEVEDLKANPNAPGRGVCIEAHLDRGRGPVATVLVKRGTLCRGDYFVAGTTWGRVRAMFNPDGDEVKEAPPSAPVLVMGFDDVFRFTAVITLLAIIPALFMKTTPAPTGRGPNVMMD